MATIFELFRQDFRYALRLIRRNPGLSAVIVLSLAIGIGANTAIFSVADTLMLKPLPYPDQDRLMALWLRSPGLGLARDWPSPGEYSDIRDQNHVFSDLAIARGDSFNLTGHGQPERIDGLRTSSSLFRILGAKPFIGRLFGREEDDQLTPSSALLTWSIWKRLFNGDPGIVGQSVVLNGRALRVTGVLGPEFSLNAEVMPTVGDTDKLEVFVPIAIRYDGQGRRSQEIYNVMARLRPGVTPERAQADIDVIAARIRARDRRDPSFGITVLPLAEQVTGTARRFVMVLLGAVVLVLLVACANVANLLLSRAIVLEREAAVRAAIGASRSGLMRQLLVESAVLSTFGAAAGLLLAYGLIAVLRIMQPGNIPRVNEIEINGPVLAFTMTIAVATGILFGLAPALRVSRVDLNTCLRTGGRSVRSSLHSDRLRSALVVAEMALSLILLVGAGLLLRSFMRLEHVEPGFDPRDVSSLRIAFRWPNYTRGDQILRFLNALQERAERIPGVVAAGASSSLPMAGSDGWTGVEVEGYEKPLNQPELQVRLRSATPDYFRAMRIPLRAGRIFTTRDVKASEGVVVVDETMARHFWPGGSPIGKRLRLTEGVNPWMTVIGVIGVVHQDGLNADTGLAVYFPETQLILTTLYFVARTRADPALSAGDLIHEIHAVDPDMPVFDVSSMDERVARSLARQRFAMTMLAAFAAFALILAGVGVYGVMSYLVTQSAHDIGVRIALGARPVEILRMVAGQGMTLAGAGLATGLFGAVLLTRFMASLMFGISPTDALTFTAVSAFLMAVAILASLVPALRAARLDPVVALRQD